MKRTVTLALLLTAAICWAQVAVNYIPDDNAVRTFGGASAPDTFTIAITFGDYGYCSLDPTVSAVRPAWRAMATPDSVYVDTDGTYLRYASMEDAYPTTCARNNNYQTLMQARNDGLLGSGAGKNTILWFDVEAFLPDDCTILDARFPILPRGSAARTLDANQGWYAVLDTFAADASWLEADAGNCGTLWKMDCSWLYKDFDITESWAPALDDRDWLWDYGVVGDPTFAGETLFSAALYDTAITDVTRLVQYIVSYDMPNYGFWVQLDDGESQIAFRMGNAATEVDRNPILYITYSTASYSGPWNGHEMPFVLMSDDGVDVTTEYSDSTAAHGVHMTHFIDFHDVLPATDSAWEQIQAVMAAGHDIQFHSYYDYTSGVPHSLVSTGADSLVAALTREQIISALGLSPVDSLTSLLDLAYPSGEYGALAIDQMRAMGYRSGRGTTSRSEFALGRLRQIPEWAADGTVAAQQSDSARVLAPNVGVNIYAIYSRATASYLNTNNPSASCDSVVGNLQRLIDESMRYDQGAAFIVAHDKDYATGRTGGIMTAEQMGCIAEWLAARPWIWTPTWSELIDFYTSEATAIDAPPWAASNHSGITAADGVYYYWSLD